LEPSRRPQRRLLDDAAEVPVFHNHPSGDLEPSRDDLDLTRRLVDAGRAISVPVVDHVVVAGRRERSLRMAHPERFMPSARGSR
jgi:DNA repair protein RadC